MRNAPFVMKLILTGFIACMITPMAGQPTSSGWVAMIAGADYQIVGDVETDLQGNIYSIGSFTGTTDFDGSSMTNNKTSKGERDIFVTKHLPDGQLVWVATFGGSLNDNGFGLDIQDSGDVYAVGSFEGQADFDPGADELSLTASGQQDMFIVKLNSTGSLIWAHRFGSTSVDEANDVSIDNDNNIYIVGRFVGTVDFNPGSATSNLQSGGSPDAFILKLSNQGDYIWAYDIGSSGNNEKGDAVVVDGQNNVIIAGSFSGTTDFDPGSGEQNVFGAGNADPFYLKLNSAGAFVWVTTFTGTEFDYSSDIDVDKDNNLVTHGSFGENINPDPGNPNTIIPSVGAEDSYTAKINSNGELAWLHALGGTGIEFAYGVAVDALGDVYVTGFYNNSPDFDPGNDEFLLPSAGLEDTYIVKYSSQGDFVWAKRTGGTSGDAGYGIDISASGDVVLTGSFFSTSDLDPEPDGTLNIQSKGSADVFILKIEQMITSTTDELALTGNWNLNPNPSTGVLSISGVDQFPVTITLMDLAGSMILEPYFLYSPNQMIDLHHLPSGIYFINIQSAAEKAILKWIKI